VSTVVFNVEELERFFTSAAVLDVRYRLRFENDLRVKDIKSYLDELLSNWRNYELLVLDFLGVSEAIQKDILNEISYIKEENLESPIDDTEDPSAIFFDVSVWKVVKVRDHYEFFINVSTHDHSFKKQINKRFNVINRLCSNSRNSTDGSEVLK
jgi:hypothetical protein